MKRCQGSRGGGDVGSGTGSLSRPESGPGSSGACTSGITGSTGFALAADFADLRGGGSGLVGSRHRRRDRDRLGGRPQWRRGDLDHRTADADLGQRQLPCEAVEPPVRRHRQPALGHHAVGGPHRIAGRAHGAAHPFAHAAFVAVLGSPRSPPSAWRPAASAPTDTAPAPRARRRIRAHRARRAPPPARLRAGPAPCRRVSACASRRSRALSPSRKFA